MLIMHQNLNFLVNFHCINCYHINFNFIISIIKIQIIHHAFSIHPLNLILNFTNFPLLIIKFILLFLKIKKTKIFEKIKRI